MSQAPFEIKPFKGEDRTQFSSGSEPLDTYFQTQVSQDIKRRVTACFIAVHRDSEQIAGYYTLSAYHLNLSVLGEDWRKKLPRYPIVPAALVGRLAIDHDYQGQGLGGALLYDAVERAHRSDIAAAMIVVDAKDEVAAGFYLHHGFRRDPDNMLRLFAPIRTLLV